MYRKESESFFDLCSFGFFEGSKGDNNKHENTEAKSETFLARIHTVATEAEIQPRSGRFSSYNYSFQSKIDHNTREKLNQKSKGKNQNSRPQELAVSIAGLAAVTKGAARAVEARVAAFSEQTRKMSEKHKQRGRKGEKTLTGKLA